MFMLALAIEFCAALRTCPLLANAAAKAVADSTGEKVFGMHGRLLEAGADWINVEPISHTFAAQIALCSDQRSAGTACSTWHVRPDRHYVNPALRQHCTR